MARITDYPISLNQLFTYASEYSDVGLTPYRISNIVSYYNNCIPNFGHKFSDYLNVPPNGMSIYWPISYGYCNSCNYVEYFLDDSEGRVYSNECLIDVINGYGDWVYSYNDNASYIVSENGYLSNYSPCGFVGCE